MFRNMCVLYIFFTSWWLLSNTFPTRMQLNSQISKRHRSVHLFLSSSNFERAEILKSSLLEAISGTRRRKSIESGGEGLFEEKQKIFKLVEELENITLQQKSSYNNMNLCANGAWNLVYSARISTKLAPFTTGSTMYPSFIDILSGNLYKIFFKFAPFLAGGSSSNKMASSIVNEQYIDLNEKKVENIVKFTIPNINEKVVITVCGEADVMSSDKTNQLSVIFTSFNLQFKNLIDITLPLPRPTGSLTTTYCDSDLRISRGGQGGLFIVKRLPDRKAGDNKPK